MSSTRSVDEFYSSSPDSAGTGSPSGKKSSRPSVAIQRAKMDEMARKIRAKEVVTLSYFENLYGIN